MLFTRHFFISCLTVCLLSACHHVGSSSDPRMEDAKYWQRKNATSALYLQGPKAQQQLHTDIADCVVKIRELENLGEIRRAIPAEYYNNNVTDGWDAPQRNGYLYNEHSDFHDFEQCMSMNGWERVEYLPFGQAAVARDAYLARYGRQNTYNTKLGREAVTTINQPSATLSSELTYNE